MQITLDSEIQREFEYMLKLHKQCGAPNPFDNVEDLVGYILSSIADGSRRPGSWERQILVSMGLIADCDEHNEYRQHYGEPE